MTGTNFILIYPSHGTICLSNYKSKVHTDYLKKKGLGYLTDQYNKEKQNPEWVSKHKEYAKEYRQRPKVKEHHNNYIKEWRKLHPETERKRIKKDPKKFWAYGTLYRHKNDAGCEIQITPDELYKFVQDKNTCAICGVSIDWERYNGKGLHYQRPSLDRINNEKIINLETIQILCYGCNIAKGKRTMQEFITYCKEIASRY